MKNLFILLTAFIIISTTTSCSKDDIDPNINLLGVWEKGVFSANSTDIYTLVFGSENTGLRISSTTFTSGEVISTTSGFKWKVIDNIITISESDDASGDGAYEINTEGQLVLNSDLHLEKVSDSYLEYY